MKKSVKNLIAVVIGTAAMLCSISAYAQVSVKVNSADIEFDTPPVIINGRTMIPIRAVAEQMGLKVGWNGEIQTVTIQNYNSVAKLTIGEDVMLFNDSSIKLDSAPIIIDDRTCLPLRAVAEAFGAEVLWDGEKEAVTINALTTNKLVDYIGHFKRDNISFYYDDELFIERSDDRFVELSAIAALCAKSEHTIREFCKAIGFEQTKTYNYDTDAGNVSNFSLSKKKINGKTIISVIVNSTEKNEWHSNFEIYKDADTPTDTHYGFDVAAQNVYSAFEEYVKNEKDYSVWVCGHSRGGAVANVLSGMLKEKDVFAITFAAPNITTKPQNDVNVKNYVNESDIITQIPLSKKGWNYARNGIDIIINADNPQKMHDVFYELTRREYKPLSDVGEVVDEIYALAPTPYDYYKKINNEITTYQYFQNNIVPLLDGTSFDGLGMMFDSAYGSVTSFFVVNSAGEKLKALSLFGIKITAPGDGNGIPYEHCIENYISKLRS